MFHAQSSPCPTSSTTMSPRKCSGGRGRIECGIRPTCDTRHGHIRIPLPTLHHRSLSRGRRRKCPMFAFGCSSAMAVLKCVFIDFFYRRNSVSTRIKAEARTQVDWQLPQLPSQLVKAPFSWACSHFYEKQNDFIYLYSDFTEPWRH